MIDGIIMKGPFQIMIEKGLSLLYEIDSTSLDFV